MIKVMIVDDHAIVREGMKKILSLCTGIEIVSEASNGREALEVLEIQPVDIVLIDIRMPVMDGVKATKYIKDRYPNIKVIILTTFNEDEYIFEGLKNGADGYILKSITPAEVIEGIKSVYSGNTLLQPEIATKVVRELNNKNRVLFSISKSSEEACKLTSRETEIAKQVSLGKSNREICKLLCITEGTVRNHISSILDKLGLRDRTQIALYIRDHD